MAVIVGFLTTALGLVFALLVTRTNLRYRRFIRAISVIPIITPPFVIGLAIILLFGLSGIVTTTVSDMFGLTPTRWVYGLPGIVIAQTLAYTIAFLVLIGVVESVSPSMEEAAQTLRASPMQVLNTVSLPLIRRDLPTPFCLASSKAWRISATRLSSAAITTFCRRRSSLQLSARNMIRAVPPCWRSCCCHSR